MASRPSFEALAEANRKKAAAQKAAATGYIEPMGQMPILQHNPTTGVLEPIGRPPSPGADYIWSDNFNKWLRIQQAQPPAPISSTKPSPATDFSSQFDQISNALGQAPEIGYNPIAQDFAKAYAPSPIKGVGDEFFTSQREGLKEKLRQEFFGQTGTAQQSASNESASGRLGSGVGQRILEETVARPFMEASNQIDRGVMEGMLQERARVEGFNAEQYGKFTNLLATMQAADSSNALTAATANAQLKSQYTDLAGRLAAAKADAAAGILSQEKIAQLDADTRTYIASMDVLAKDAALREERRANMAREGEEFRRGQTQYLQTIGQFKPSDPQQQAAANELSSAYNIPATTPLPVSLPQSGAYDGESKTLPNGKTFQWKARGRTGYSEGEWVEL